MNSRIANDSGFTLVEVLVSVVLFMIAFVTIVSLFDSTLNRISVKELRTASELAEETLNAALVGSDTTSYDSTMSANGVLFGVERTVVVSDGLKAVTVVVSREKTGKRIVELYDAVVANQK